jgi:hypothetical protein
MQSAESNQQVKSQRGVEILTDEGLWALHGAPLDSTDSTAAPSNIQFRWRRWGTYSAGALFSLCLHALLFGTIIFGTHGRPPLKPLTEGASASQQNEHATEFVSTLLLLDDHSITSPDQPPDDSAYEALQPNSQPVSDSVFIAALNTPTLPEPGGSVAGADENAPSSEAAGDEAGRAVLFGRYMGQIKARIERAWDYPVSRQTEKFDCKVQIKQNAHGDVQEVTLQRCGNDPAWQTSLVQAIQSASPLSAPPDDSVFTDLITLSFDAKPVAIDSPDVTLTSTP